MLRLGLFSSIGLLGFLAFKLRPKHRPATPSIPTKTDIPSSSPPPPPPPSGKFKYDVFLSFRGEDTRKNFTDHLYSALIDKGIITFRDDEELESGVSIAPNLLKAIEESRYAVVVFSRNYANSSWCLDEIAKIVECMKHMGQKIFPVFYDVDPYEVRRQKGDHFGKAFEEHQKRFEGNPDKVQRWKDALFEVANLSGCHLQDGYESKVIRDIVQKIFTDLNQKISTYVDGLVGMDSHLNKMLSYLDIGGPDDVRIIGIWGMGGIGKTTIAQVVSEREKPWFEGYCFLKDVREVTERQGVVHLQNQLLFNLLKNTVNVQHTEMGKNIIRRTLCAKKVLIVLDDVDNNDQLEALCDRTWFGPGSRIILTSRDESLLRTFPADKVYKVNPLTSVDALKLFRMKAFEQGQVGEDFLELSKEFLKYANGLPLAIKVLGGFVKGRKLELWSSALDRLKQNPEKKIIDVLKVSFEGLQESEKKIFLDIACFLKGYDRDRITRILQGCDGHCPNIDIEVLIEKSMLTLIGRKLWMHDLIQTMGQEIVLQQYPNKPEKRSRLWVPKEIIHVLDQSKATTAIESILLQRPTEDNVVHSINDSFSQMDRLRLLNIWNVKFSGNIKHLSNELQYLEWHECPLDSFQSYFQPDNLVELHLRLSRIEQLWRGKKGWGMLRTIDMAGSQYLISTPDFTEVPFLEILVLEGCTSLVEVHPSLGFLKKLVCLNMKNCKSVESMPPFTSLESLEILSLALCSRLKKFPKIEGNMDSLLELYLDGCISIEELPLSVERLNGHTTLNLTGMKNLKCLSFQGCQGHVPRSLLSPTSFSSLTSLIRLDLSYCNMMDGDIPDDLSSLISLRMLDLSGNCFVQLPESFSQLSKLETLFLINCRQLKLLPKKLPLSLQYVRTEGCTSLKLGVTTVNSLISSALGDSHKNGGASSELVLIHKKQKKVELLSLSNPLFVAEAVNEIPEWFSTTSTITPISIPTGDNKWKGVAACAVFSVNTSADTEFFNYFYQITLETDVVRLEPYVINWEEQLRLPLRSSSHLLLIYYEPGFKFPMSELIQSTVVRAIFETNNPFMVVEKCGIRLVYEQDAGWFSANMSHEVDSIHLNKDERADAAVLEVGWVSIVDNCWNWAKFIPPSEEEYFTLVMRKNIESVLPRYLEALNHSSAMFKFNFNESPAWFKKFFVFYMDTISAGFWPIEIPHNLHKSKKWMGFALHASIAERGGHTINDDNYRVYFKLITGGKCHKTLSREVKRIKSSEEHHQLLVVYIPRAQIPETLFTQASTTEMHISFFIDSPNVKFRTSGARVVYQEDIQGFADTIIRCMQKEDSLEFYNKLVMENWIKLIRLQGDHLDVMSNPKERDSRSRREKEFELHSQKFKNWDWSSSISVKCDFRGAEISKWETFMHIKEGNSLQIQLHPKLFDDANWLGIAVCAFTRLSHEHPNMSVGSTSTNPDSEYNVLTCWLNSDGHFRFQEPFRKLGPSEHAYDWTWFLYHPRRGKCLFWRQPKLAGVTFSSSTPCLAVHSCALRLVYKEDVEHLVQTLTSCELP